MGKKNYLISSSSAFKCSLKLFRPSSVMEYWAFGFPSDELFDGLDISESLQGFQVAGQIPVGQLHQLLHGVEVG